MNHNNTIKGIINFEMFEVVQEIPHEWNKLKSQLLRT